MAVLGHGASRKVLDEAGARHADVLIAATSSDEVNLLSCLTAKKLGCQSTIARVRSPEYTDDIVQLREELGLSFAINPEEACAREVFRLLQYPSFLSREQFAKGRVEVVRFKITEASPLNGLALKNLAGKIRMKVLLCAVDRDGQLVIPNGNFVLQPEDEVFVTAARADLVALIKNLGLGKRKVTQVTIVGGGLLGFYLAHMLSASGVGVKIIERDEERCFDLSEDLPDVDIVHGDGTDADVLYAEGVERSDALVSLTGIDEENIVLSMYARHIGVPTTITKCNRDMYADMFHKMGIDTVVSPKVNCAEEIVRYVRAMANSVGGQMVAMHRLANGKAEAMEFRADGSCKLAGIPLHKLKLKKGILVASITRGRETMIAAGDTVIHVDDAVVVVAETERGIYGLNDILAD